MPLSKEQEEALAHWRAGKNVRVSAVPGAGKSRVLVEAASAVERGNALIVAYNRELRDATVNALEQRGLTDTVACMTFHGLCSRCIQSAPDDDALLDAIEAAERGEVEVKRLQIEALLIDECQDCRPSFLRLLRVVLEPNVSMQHMVVGDEEQLLYDYDEDDPADIEILRCPWNRFVSDRAWIACVFTISFRLTVPIARFVNRVFDTGIEPGNTEYDDPVSVYTMNVWRMGGLVERQLRGLDASKTAVLVARRRNNRPLQSVINQLSANRIPIHIVGEDGVHPLIKSCKMSVSTWHASKGATIENVIVFGVDADSARRPLFVALTRASRKLFIIMDEQRPHPEIVRAVAACGRCVTDEATRNATRRLANLPPPWTPTNDGVRACCFDDWSPRMSTRWLREHMRVETLIDASEDDAVHWAGEVVQVNDVYADVSWVYARAGRLYHEHARTGRLRVVESMKNPARVAPVDRIAAILAGEQRWFVSTNAHTNRLLGDDLQRLALTAATRCATVVDWCTLALGAVAWDGWHHTMRQMFPMGWVDPDVFQTTVDTIGHLLPAEEETEFDLRAVRRVGEDCVAHMRVHAVCADRIYLFVWTAALGSAENARAGIAAAIHGKPCILANLRTGHARLVHTTDNKKILERCCRR